MLKMFSKEKDEGDELVTPKCNSHEKLVAKLSRIEGENIAILAMLGVILTVIMSQAI